MPLESYQIKVVEPISLRPRPAREQALRAATNNLFRLASRDYVEAARFQPHLPRQHRELELTHWADEEITF